MRALLVVLAIAAVTQGSESQPQTSGTANARSFDNAEINRNTNSLPPGGTLHLFDGGSVSAANVSYRRLLEYAHRQHHLDRPTLEGVPAWMDSDRFDVTARATAGHLLDADGVPRQTLTMLRTFLAARARLRVRVERREVPAYALVLARSDGALGPGLRRSAVDCRQAVARMITGQRPQANCGFQEYVGRYLPTVLTMADMASLFSGLLDRPVIDRTGLTGPFSAAIGTVEIRPSGPFDPGYRPSDPKKELFDLMQVELGLKLEPITAPIDVIVIEHAEDPTKGDTLPIVVDRTFMAPGDPAARSWDVINVTVYNPGPKTVVAWGVRADVELEDGKPRRSGGSVDGVETLEGTTGASNSPILAPGSRYTLTFGIPGDGRIEDVRRVTAEPSFVIFADDTALGDERSIRFHFESRARRLRAWLVIQKAFDDAMAATSNPQEVFVAVGAALDAVSDKEMVASVTFRAAQNSVRSALKYPRDLDQSLKRMVDDMRIRRAALAVHQQRK